MTVYSIVNEEPNAEEQKAKIKAYEEAHRTQIVIRQSQRADEERAIQDRIAAEQREAERRKRDYEEEERAIALTKRKFKQESTEVLLGVGYKKPIFVLSKGSLAHTHNRSLIPFCFERTATRFLQNCGPLKCKDIVTSSNDNEKEGQQRRNTYPQEYENLMVVCRNENLN